MTASESVVVQRPEREIQHPQPEKQDDCASGEQSPVRLFAFARGKAQHEIPRQARKMRIQVNVFR